MILHRSALNESATHEVSTNNESWPRQNEQISIPQEWLSSFLIENGFDGSIWCVETLGGLVNSNYRVITCDGSNYFLRIASENSQKVAKENYLLGKLGGQIPVPSLLATGCYGEHPAMASHVVRRRNT